jgi:hypothetical protein
MGVFIFLALVSGVSAYSCALQLPNQEKVLPALKISGLNGSGSLAVSSSSVGEAVDFVAILKNQGPFPVHDLRLVHVEPAEYFIERVCWQQGGKVSCQNVLENSATIRPVIEGGQSFTIWGVIRPARAHEKGKVTAVLSWVDESGNTSDIGITLGDFASQNWYEHWGLRFYGFVKDFALPLVFVVLGIAYQWWDKRREVDRQEKDQERAQILQTWNNMLPTSHQYATKHYMPVAAAATGVVSGLAAYGEALEAKDSIKAAEWTNRVFYTMALLGKRLRHLGDAVGGFYFKDRIGEELVSDSLTAFRNHYYMANATVLEKFSLLMDNVEVNETYGVFLKKLSGVKDPLLEPIFQNAYADFVTWLNSGPNYKLSLGNLRAFLAVLEYEMNRPYHFWYGRSETLRLDEEIRDTLNELIKTTAKRPDKTGFDRLAEEYLRKGSGNP